ncbi:MAG: family 43 glycosylhydrolase [Nocardioides sp.]|nr:family 43 glycosylhydrolase [Nocardioides sp.]
MHSRVVVPLVALLAVLAGLLAPAHADESVPRPVLNIDFPDPTVVSTPSGLVGYSTGDLVPHAWSRNDNGRWQREPGVLAKRPSWAREGGIWAVDVARVRGRWLLYFAAPVRGLGEHGRCIGVARATRARGPFRPVGRSPLVCPSYADAPQALDPLLPRDPSLPRAGVIDPSVFIDSAGAPHLLYKTDRTPSTIRMVALTRSGQGVGSGEVSRELVRSEGVVENPVLVEQPEGFVLIVSEGDWTTCDYRTLWLRSTDLSTWAAAETGVLLDEETSGLCGPGGADLVEVPGRPKSRLFLHGWTCHSTDLPCAGRSKWDHRDRARGVRAMYAAVLGWSAGLPQVEGWLDPR